MRLESNKLLYDIQNAAERLSRFVEGKTFNEYEADELLRSGVERQFEIIGEALSQLSKVETDVAVKITDYKKIISF